MKIVVAIIGAVLLGLVSLALLAFCIWALTPVATGGVIDPGYWQSVCIVALVSVLGTCFRPWKNES